MDSLMPWIGGKKLLRDAVIARFPDKFERYVEVFGGAAWVLFRKDQHAKIEVYNDADSNLVNLFRCVKYHPAELQRELSLLIHSRETFADYRAQHDVSGMTDIQRAARFYFLVRCSYGADQRTFSCSSKRLSLDHIANIHNRLDKVIIEHRDFERLIHVYDRNETLFFCDPPYMDSEGYYSGFSTDDHERLKTVLTGIKGHFILTYNDHPYIHDLYRDYKIEEVSRNNSLKTRYGSSKYRELIISNY